MTSGLPRQTKTIQTIDSRDEKAEDATTRRKDHEDSGLLNADNELQRRLDRSQERHVDHRGAIKPICIPGDPQAMTDDAQEARKQVERCRNGRSQPVAGRERDEQMKGPHGERSTGTRRKRGGPQDTV